MLKDQTQVRLPLVINFVGNPRRAQDVECEVLSLRAINICVAVDPPEPNAAGDVGSESAAGEQEIVTQADGDAVIIVLRTAKNRLRHAREVKLIVAAKKSLAIDRTKTPSP